jgi:hypothetical protein
MTRLPVYVPPKLYEAWRAQSPEDREQTSLGYDVRPTPLLPTYPTPKMWRPR